MKYEKRSGDQLNQLVSAELAHLVVGGRLFLRDPRQTPVVVTAHDPATASFTVQVSDFEDVGAEWVLPLWDVSKFQTVSDAELLSVAQKDVLGANIHALNRNTQIECSDEQLSKSNAKISTIQREIQEWLRINTFDMPSDGLELLSRSLPCNKWSDAFENFMSFKNLRQLDKNFVQQFASNPNAGETVKGHRIVLAEMGLCPYDGPIVRDPKTFEGEWSKARRSEHILTRLAFMHAVFERFQLKAIPLFRTVYSRSTLNAPRNTGFVSSTFSQDVALSLFRSGQNANMAAMYWQEVPVERVFMSCFETAALSEKYQEAEAVLLFDPDNRVF